jgi:hypothetical protein
MKTTKITSALLLGALLSVSSIAYVSASEEVNTSSEYETKKMEMRGEYKEHKE